MSFAVRTVLKPMSMATNGCLISAPALFATSKASSYSHLRPSIPFKPVKLSYSSSLSVATLFTLKKKEPLLRVSVIAAQEQEENPVVVEEKADGEQDIHGGFNWDALDNEVEGQVSDGAVERVEAVEDSGGSDEYVEPPEEAKLYVGNMPYDVDSEQLAKLFEDAGVVEIAEVIYNRETDQSRGFGFVSMSTVEEAEKAVEMFHRYELNGRYLTVNKAAPRGTRPERRPRASENAYKIYVGNLPWTVNDERLEQLFSEHGKVLKVQVVLDRETGRSRGFAFVVMSSESERNDAIANLDGEILDGRAIRVSVAEDKPRRSSSF